MLPINWNKLAVQDLYKIVEYIAADDASAAHALATGFEASIDRLADFPNLGTFIKTGLRRLFLHENYALYYRPTKTEVRILRIKHVARKFP